MIADFEMLKFLIKAALVAAAIVLGYKTINKGEQEGCLPLAALIVALVI